MERRKFSATRTAALMDITKNLNSRYKIGDTYYQRDWHGGPDFETWSGSCEITITNMGIKKICRRCKREFFTFGWRSRVICLDCKAELKTRPKGFIYEKICPICHLLYTSKRSDARTCQKDSCRKAYYRKKERENNLDV